MTMMSLYCFLSGPMMWVAVGVFMAGTVWQTVRFFLFTRKHPPRPRNSAIGKLSVHHGRELIDRTSFKYRLLQLKLTLPGKRPFFILMTTFFHVNLLVLPFLIQGHTMMAGFGTGVYLPSLPDPLVDLLTLLTLLCTLIFFVRRIFVRDVRAITTVSDFGMLALASAPFLTGYLAYHQLFDYRTMILLHIALGEMMLMLIPFTRMIHMVYFFLNRFILVHQHTLGNRGNRVWNTQAVRQSPAKATITQT